MLLPRYSIPVALVVALHALALVWVLGRPVRVPPAVPATVMQVTLEAPTPVQSPAPAVVPVSKPLPAPTLTARPPVAPAASPVPAPAPVQTPANVPQPVLAATPPPVANPPPTATEEVTPPRVDASYKGNPAPAYPRASRALGEAGTVHLKLFVNADGSVGQVMLESSSGYARLDHAAEDAVARWKLVPARRGNQPIAMWYALPINFNLTAEN